MLNTEERRGYQALIAFGSLLGVLAAAILLSVASWSMRSDLLAVVACAVAGGLVSRPLARREAQAWARRRRERDAA